MSTVAEVKLWGRRVGAVALATGADVATFQFDPEFIESGIEVAPLTMPLSPRPYAFGSIARDTFHGLPGLLADSLPDRFGTALINVWLAGQGRPPDSLNAIERLCYTGTRGMGALGFHPAVGPGARQATRIQVEKLVELASDILAQRGNLHVAFDRAARSDALNDILKVGTSAGGARAKAVIAWNRDTNEVRSGQVSADPGFEHWLIKFDGVHGNRDKEATDPQGFGAIEYAYYRMACDAGILMSECRLFEEGGRRHFMTRRFDRTAGGRKLHMQSLGALAHMDFNMAGAHSYEEAFLVLRRLGLTLLDAEQLYRRMVFNIMARNQDDHVKNIAFLMNRSGTWTLAPAYDLTYSYQPDGRWTSSHQMSLNGKRDDFTRDDFRACARLASLKRGVADAIVAETRQVVANWREYADAAGVDPDHRDRIYPALRL